MWLQEPLAVALGYTGAAVLAWRLDSVLDFESLLRVVRRPGEFASKEGSCSNR